MALISNSPVMNDKVFKDATFTADEQSMTIEGTIIRSIVLLFCVVAAAIIPWHIFFSQLPAGETKEMYRSAAAYAAGSITPYMIGGVIVGLIMAVIISFKPHLAPVLSIPYALAEGVAIGGISAFTESMYPGIVMQAASSTFAVFFVMLLLYYKRIIVPTAKFRAVLTAAILGVGVVYLINFVMGFWGTGLSMVNSNSGISIGFSALVCIIASLSLLCDFQIIENAAARRAPKYMAWYGAFAMMVTLIWLYLEILRLLSKLRSRN